MYLCLHTCIHTPSHGPIFKIIQLQSVQSKHIFWNRRHKYQYIYMRTSRFLKFECKNRGSAVAKLPNLPCSFTLCDSWCKMSDSILSKDGHLPWNEERKRVQFQWICTGLVAPRGQRLKWTPQAHHMEGKKQKGHCERLFDTNVLVLANNTTTFSRRPNV